MFAEGIGCGEHIITSPATNWPDEKYLYTLSGAGESRVRTSVDFSGAVNG